MEIVGKIIVALPEISGVSKVGNSWKKREYVLETLDSYPKKVFFDFFGERADQYPLQVGQMITLSFDIESREYNGRWYTSIRGWKSAPYDGNAASAPAPAANAPAYPNPAPAYNAPAPQAQQAPAFTQAPAPQTPAYPQAPAPAAPASPNDDLPF